MYYTVIHSENQRNRTTFSETYSQYNGVLDDYYDADEEESKCYIKAVRIA